MALPEGVKVEDMHVTYSQKPDSCDDSPYDQDLEVKIVDAGGGPYIILKTERWGMDLETAEAMFAAIIADFKKRFGDQ